MAMVEVSAAVMGAESAARESSAPINPAPGEAAVDGDSIEPGGKARLRPEARELLVGLVEALLGQVFGLGQRTGHAIGERMPHVLMTPRQLGERLGIAPAALVDPCLVLVAFAHAAFYTHPTAGRGA